MHRELPAIDVGPREVLVHAQLDEREVDALIITSPSNVRWLTGFAGSNGTVVIHHGSITLFTDSRYADRAPGEVAAVGSSCEVVIARETMANEIGEQLGSVELVGLEADHITWAQQTQINDSWLPKQTLVPLTAVIDELRARKDDAEIARIEAAARIVDTALAAVAPDLTTGLTERAFAQRLDAEIRAGGAQDIGFDTIVASGPNGAIPHHSPGDRAIENGDLVIVDVGAMVDGYRSDMTRTFSVGPMSAEHRRQYDTVIAAQQAGVAAMRAGAETSAVDTAARAVIAEAGWAENFTHGTGHGIGLDIHELPRVGKATTDVYEIGTVATVEPGVYLPGIAGVRIEDTCVVTADGARRLTGFPKEGVAHL